PIADHPTPNPTVTPYRVQGGGLRLSHLAVTLPANLAVLRAIFGDLELVLALVGMVAAWRMRPLFLLVVPYSIVSVLFFSMWTLPGARYLTGAILLVPLLVLQGACTLAALPARIVAHGQRVLGGIAAAIVALGSITLVVLAPPGVPSALPWVNGLLAATV